MDLWRRLAGAPEMEEGRPRDPDLDELHQRQHDLINKATALGLRDQWNERNRQNWRADGRHAS